MNGLEEESGIRDPSEMLGQQASHKVINLSHRNLVRLVTECKQTDKKNIQ